MEEGNEGESMQSNKGGEGGRGVWVRVEGVCQPGRDVVFICGEQLQVPVYMCV